MALPGKFALFIFGEFAVFFGRPLRGIVPGLTIIAIPSGKQCFRLAAGLLAPFGREVQETEPCWST